MIALQTFLVSFSFSFIGSIPPGTINISVVQLSLERQFNAALRFSLAAALVEYPYAFIAVKFEEWITSSPAVIDNFTLIAGIAMVLLGILNLWPSEKPSKVVERLKKSGFRKGILISIANPLAIPFWIGVTAYLKSNEWVNVSNNYIYVYVLGVSAGTFCLLALMAVLGQKIAPMLQHSVVIKNYRD